ncbi:SAM-dependent methyltransferase [Aeoliella sp. ICT_H6.2]|uniref:S-adenosyl-L-methionine-dependent methyltransferase n=1 Tax=Aeoliella straminimaris TaxID=2954799 RepID=A0A9X2FEM8_9BACT|nr:SAM-dependent methyltransferase [Aeoliella straminimaris]MCO6047640.1 SAM-dependent methyltransferase [Aeoliella straminimaris]
MSSVGMVQHVSDTALWVATYRARESERGDAVFNDPLAAKLVGERGPAIAATMPYSKLMEWVLVVRTSAIDRLIHSAIGSGVDRVLNLGAGLDTRPYRMDLPESLQWVEVDFPEIVRYKNEVLANERPVCRLQRIEADLSDDQTRRKVLKEAVAGAKRVAVITEGVIPYLSPEQVSALSRELIAEPAVDCWIQDFRQGGRGTALKKLTKRLRLNDAPLRFGVKDWLGFFVERGWQTREIIFMHDESRRIGRSAPFVFPVSLIYIAKFLASKKLREKTIKENGYVLFQRSA